MVQYVSAQRAQAMAVAQALGKGLAGRAYLYTNFIPIPSISHAIIQITDTITLAGGLPHQANKILDAGHSGSLVQASPSGDLAVQVYFNGILPHELPYFELLCDLLQQRDGLFQQHMVASGLALAAGLDFSPLVASHYIRFWFKPNPMGIKEAIEGFFDELRAIPLLNYHSPAQLQMAKERILAKRQISLDRFTTGVQTDLTDRYYYSTSGSNAYVDSLWAVNKLNMLRFTRRLLAKQTFVVTVAAPKGRLAEAKGMVWPTRPLPAYLPTWDNHRDAKLNAGAQATLDTVAYILNLSPWLQAEMIVGGEASRKVKRRRLGQVNDYLKMRGVDNTLLPKYGYRGNMGETVEIKPMYHER